MAPEARWSSYSIYIHIGYATCFWRFSRIIATFTPEMNTNMVFYKINKRFWLPECRDSPCCPKRKRSGYEVTCLKVSSKQISNVLNSNLFRMLLACSYTCIMSTELEPHLTLIFNIISVDYLPWNRYLKQIEIDI